jgi:hypothetical protein
MAPAQTAKPLSSFTSPPVQDIFSLLDNSQNQTSLPKTSLPLEMANPSVSKGMGSGGPSVSAPSMAQPSGGGFDDLWTSSLAGVGGSSGQTAGANSKKSMLDLDREKTMNSLWNAPTASPTYVSSPIGATARPSASTKNVFDDLLG